MSRIFYEKIPNFFCFFLSHVGHWNLSLCLYNRKTAMCSFLVAAQETNQRKRLGDALAAKSFGAASINRHGLPDFEPPSPSPLPGPRRRTGGNRIFRYPDVYILCSCLFRILPTPDQQNEGTDKSVPSGFIFLDRVFFRRFCPSDSPH